MDFAQIENDIVVRIILVDKQDCLNSNGIFDEQVGAAFCNALIQGHWIQSGYSKSTRKNTAMIGCKYDAVNDGYVYDKPFDSWVFDPVSCDWEAPIEYPTLDGNISFTWDEETTSWIKREVL